MPGRRPYIPPHLTTGSEEQGYVENVFRSVGGLRYRIVVPRAGRYGSPTKGVPDDLYFFPNHLVLLAWDSKAGHEFCAPSDPRRLSKEQAEFIGHMNRGYITAGGWGDRDTAREWLSAGGLARAAAQRQIIKSS